MSHLAKGLHNNMGVYQFRQTDLCALHGSKYFFNSMETYRLSGHAALLCISYIKINIKTYCGALLTCLIVFSRPAVDVLKPGFYKCDCGSLNI